MTRRYSKPQYDVMHETSLMIRDNRQRLEEQARIQKALKRAECRQHCVLCRALLSLDAPFPHRGVDYVQCAECGQVQTVAMPPEGYPESERNVAAFHSVYPRLSEQERSDRKQRIYLPKLNWALQAMTEVGVDEERIRSLKWLELGCGNGLFLECLRDAGITNYQGCDADRVSLERAAEIHGETAVFHNGAALSEALEKSDADVFVSFFVMEHVEDGLAFFEAFARKPEGTMLVMAVPMFGFSAMFEEISSIHFARNLDSILHTQLFTEKSISHCMNIARAHQAGEWIFGQDSVDLYRAMHLVAEPYPPALQEEMLAGTESVVDDIQKILDRAHLADARHVLWIRGSKQR